MWSEALGGLDHASRASELAPIGAGCCLADCHSLRRLHPMTGFFRAPPYGDRTNNVPNRQAAARARRAKPGANAPARRSAATAAPGRITGGGGRGGSIKPHHPSHPTPRPPQHPRQHKPHSATHPNQTTPPKAPIPPPTAPSPAPRSPRRPPCQTLHAHTEPFRPFR